MNQQPEPQRRPSQDVLVKMGTFAGVLTLTGSVSKACTMAGWKRVRAYEWRNDYEPFAEKWDAALEEFKGKLHEELGDMALGKGRYDRANVRALIKMNEAHNPELFSQQQVKHQISGEVRHTLIQIAPTLEELPVAASTPALASSTTPPEDAEFTELDGLDDE